MRRRGSEFSQAAHGSAGSAMKRLLHYMMTKVGLFKFPNTILFARLQDLVYLVNIHFLRNIDRVQVIVSITATLISTAQVLQLAPVNLEGVRAPWPLNAYSVS